MAQPCYNWLIFSDLLIWPLNTTTTSSIWSRYTLCLLWPGPRNDDIFKSITLFNYRSWYSQTIYFITTDEIFDWIFKSISQKRNISLKTYFKYPPTSRYFNGITIMPQPQKSLLTVVSICLSYLMEEKLFYSILTSRCYENNFKQIFPLFEHILCLKIQAICFC